jgi:hypothetical protein
MSLEIELSREGVRATVVRGERSSFFSCPGSAGICPDCGIPPIGGHRIISETFPLNGAMQ